MVGSGSKLDLEACIRLLDYEDVMVHLKEADQTGNTQVVHGFDGFTRLHDIVFACGVYQRKGQLTDGSEKNTHLENILLEFLIRWVDPVRRSCAGYTARQSMMYSDTPSWVGDVLCYYEQTYGNRRLNMRPPIPNCSNPIAQRVIQKFLDRSYEFPFPPSKIGIIEKPVFHTAPVVSSSDNGLRRRSTVTSNADENNGFSFTSALSYHH